MSREHGPVAPASRVGSAADSEQKEKKMAEFIDRGAVKVIEIIGISDESFEDAVSQGVAKAAETVKGITGVEVESMTARVRDGKVVQYHTTLKLAFAVK
jgi:hypothetical protein